ncbi:cytochrome c [Thiobacillus sp. 65-1402]|uniref:cytochrome c n=1 Tax=Thiobacillus sp. 65-1402 TaxID=1895861 RepID=UPI00086AF9E7|nr:cytochrome c [Thiobacillus sp. 65-1402]ODU01489.1 MAG: hypothetical protein ABS89_07350 [Thiobacillus sp. SCN 63-1177]OJW81246.1 MAG: hypothetical protein BGO62_15385 [Thiobacillus sp. 65-1402]
MRIASRPLLACMMLSLATPPSVRAAGDMVLSKVMETQGRNMRLIAGGIAREDYGEVVMGAMAVIDPSHPPATLAEKFELMRFLGGKIGRFRALDRDTKERAAALVEAARTRDGEATIDAFQRLQTSCLACHAEFRKPFRDHFNRE